LENSCGNQRGIQCGNSEKRFKEELKKSSGTKWKSTFMQEKLLLLCLLFVLPLLFVLFEKNSCGNQQINVELKMKLKEELKEEILKIKEEFKVELKEELKKSSGMEFKVESSGHKKSKWKSKNFK
jgi:hypothetical protein